MPETLIEDYHQSESKPSWNDTWHKSEEMKTQKFLQWKRLLTSPVCKPIDKVDVKISAIEYNPRSEVIIKEEYSEAFIEMVDNPKHNQKMAKLLKEAKEMFPDEWE